MEFELKDILTLLGLVCGPLVAYLVGRKQNIVNVKGKEINNADDSIEALRKATKYIEDLLVKSQTDGSLINDLHKEKSILQEANVRKDAVIDYQRKENHEFALDNTKLRIKIEELDKRVSELELHNSRLAKENLQLKGRQDNEVQSGETADS